MSKHGPNRASSPRFTLSETESADTLEDFFGESQEAEDYADDWDDDEEFDAYPGEDFAEYDEDYGDDYGEDAEWVEMPEALAENSEWVEIYESGHDFYSVVESVYPELEGADHAEIEMAVAEMLEGMTDEEIEGWLSNLGRSFVKGVKKVGRVVVRGARHAAPVVARFAKPVGTAVGAAFGNPMLGAKIGGAVGAGAGILSNVLGPPRRVRRRRLPGGGRIRRRPRNLPRHRRPMRGGNAWRARGYRRRRRSRAYRTGRGFGRAARGAGQALHRVLSNRGVQRALRQGAHGAINGIFGEGMGMSDAAVLEAIIGGAEMALAEMDAERGGALAVEGGYGPDDFESSEQAFETLIALVDGDGA